jgi:hypothetical protein
MAANIFTTLSQSQEIANAVLAKVRGKNYLTAADILGYTIKKQAEAETGYASTYQLFSVSAGETPTETPIGAKINIPKDMVVSGGEVKTVTVADQPYEGAVVGDKYIDLTIANADSDHIYIPVKDLVDIYSAGNGLTLSNGAFSVVIDSNSANGLSVGANGIGLAQAVASTSGAGGSAGAMSASDKEKLDNADVTAYSGGNGINIIDHGVSINVDGANSNGLSATAAGLALAAAVASTDGAGGSAGAMTATDKEKLDNVTVATAAEVQAVIEALDNL